MNNPAYHFDKMQAGAILVCPTTTPVWTPLFAQARGLITDIGGVLAHGSIVAREYGIPAVMGTGVATQRIQSGQRIQVDGDAGTVTLLDGAGVAERAEPASQPAVQTPGTSNVQKTTLLALAAGALIGVIVWGRKRK